MIRTRTGPFYGDLRLLAPRISGKSCPTHLRVFIHNTRNTTRTLSTSPFRPMVPYQTVSTNVNTANRPRVSLKDSPNQRDTIYALATPPGRAGIGVVRISGPRAKHVWGKMILFPSALKKRAETRTTTTTLRDADPVLMRNGRENVPWNSSSIRPRQLRRCRIIDEHGEPLDDGMAVFFPGWY